MPKYVAANTDVPFNIPFEVGGELVTPDAATYTVRKNDGTVVGDADVEIDIPTSETYAKFVVPAGSNQKTVPYEVRYIEITFDYDGTTYTTSDYYIIRDSLRIPLTVDDVRNVLGVTASDVSDAAIDIFSAYAAVQDDLGSTVSLDTILTGGGEDFPFAIEAIKYKAAAVLSIGIQNSMMQMEQADNTLYKRFDKVDFTRLSGDIAGRYALALRRLTGDNPTTPVLAILTADTDAVTGV